jgi:hypothetical protein
MYSKDISSLWDLVQVLEKNNVYRMESHIRMLWKLRIPMIDSPVRD